jgi:redox-sensitive bicupin YhaK (pirin superfamily)
MWVLPNQRGLEPSWEQKRFTQADRQGKLLPVISGRPVDGALHMNQDATLFISSLAAGDEVSYTLAEGRHAYLFMIDGEVTVNGETLGKADQARIKQEDRLTIKAKATTELVLWDTV